MTFGVTERKRRRAYHLRLKRLRSLLQPAVGTIADPIRRFDHEADQSVQNGLVYRF